MPTPLSWAPNLSEESLKALAKLRESFPDEAINKLPKGIPASQKNNKSHCDVCGGFHGPAKLHLDYVGHAFVTERLLEVDPAWFWEPLAKEENGAPIFERDGSGKPIGLWITLAVAGMVRPGYGSVSPGKSDAVKELIGDAIRNAAMRFGVALDFWKKDVAASSDEDDEAEPQRSQPTGNNPQWVDNLLKETTPARILAAARKVAKEAGDEPTFTTVDEIPAELEAAVRDRLGVGSEGAPAQSPAPSEPATSDEIRHCGKHDKYDETCIDCRWIVGAPVTTESEPSNG